MGWRALLIGVVAVALQACASPTIKYAGDPVHAPALTDTHFQTADGTALPVRRWMPDDEPHAVVLAVHGFNDYSNFFDAAGAWFAGRGIAAYAYDQRGFGAAPHVGYWAGVETYAADLKALTAELRKRHSGVPLVVVGESMGGAVTLIAAAGGGLAADGLILSAPAVWGRETMPWYQVAALWLGTRIAPGWTVTGKGLDLWPSDNIEMLRALGKDDLIIKETRVDAVWGVVNLMDAASAAATGVSLPTLYLYGERDEIIPKNAFKALVAKLAGQPRENRRFALYTKGWHMLMRDNQAETVWRDMAAWVMDQKGALPSGADMQARACLLQVPDGKKTCYAPYEKPVVPKKRPKTPKKAEK